LWEERSDEELDLLDRVLAICLLFVFCNEHMKSGFLTTFSQPVI
jgi:hypothetical protein